MWTTGAAEHLGLVYLIVQSAPPHPPQTLPQPSNVEGDAVVQGLVSESRLVREPSAHYPHCTDLPLPPELATSPKILYKSRLVTCKPSCGDNQGNLSDITICYALL